MRVRVTAAAVVVAFVAAVLGSLVFVATLRVSLQQALGSSTTAQIDALEAQMRNGSTPSQVVVSGQKDVIVQVVGVDGLLVATDHPSLTAPLRTTAGLTKGFRDPRIHDSYVVLARKIYNGDLIVVARSEEQVSEASNVAAALLAIAVPIGVAALGIVVWVSVGRALRPVEAIRREATAITSDHLHRRLPVPPGTDEIPRLARTLNKMLDRIDASQRLQRQFVSDASHELRTPLAAVRQLAEVARRHPTEVDVRALAGDVLIEEQRMEELVTAFLTLALLDEDAAAGSAIDLDDVVLTEAARQRQPGGPQIDTSRVGVGQVAGDAVLFSQVVRNLLSNGLRHASTRVVVEVARGDGVVRLVVHDDGSGIPEDRREAVFERFVRLDEARNRDAGGAGLGLAIVRKVVEAAGGTVSVDTGPLGGARFVVTLPDLEDDSEDASGDALEDAGEHRSEDEAS